MLAVSPSVSPARCQHFGWQGAEMKVIFSEVEQDLLQAVLVGSQLTASKIF